MKFFEQIDTIRQAYTPFYEDDEHRLVCLLDDLQEDMALEQVVETLAHVKQQILSEADCERGNALADEVGDVIAHYARALEEYGTVIMSA